jgi:hypothetical protein
LGVGFEQKFLTFHVLIVTYQANMAPVYVSCQFYFLLPSFLVLPDSKQQFLSEIGRSAARTLDFAPSSRASSITQLILAFLISGLIHAAGDFMVNPSHFGVSLPFFLYQIIGIVLEDITLQIWSQTGIKVSPYLSRALGYVWVCCWLTLTGPSFVNGLIVLGMQNRKVVMPHLSLCMTILEVLQRRTGVVVSDLYPTPRGRTLY